MCVEGPGGGGREEFSYSLDLLLVNFPSANLGQREGAHTKGNDPDV